MVAAALVVAGAYLIGCFPTAARVGRRSGFDPAAAGSGNPGASNSFRLGGRRAGALVLLGDAGKGAVAVALGLLVDGRGLGAAAGAAAVGGHVAPVTRHFRGGKGVATAAGVIAVLEPIAAVAGAIVWLAAVAVTRKAAVASLVMVTVVVAAIALAGRSVGEVVTLSAIAVVIVVRHGGNLARLRRGEERSLLVEETRKSS